jgi:hypothetical protein
MGVTSSSQDLEDTIVDREERNIKGTTTQVVDDNLGFTALLVKTIGDGGSGGLVNDTEDLKTGDSTGIFSSLTLSVVEV